MCKVSDKDTIATRKKPLTIFAKKSSLQMFTWVLCKPLIAVSLKVTSQPVFTCPNLTIETLQQVIKYAQS